MTGGIRRVRLFLQNEHTTKEHDMMTATYTDATTGWEQRVKVAGETHREEGA